MTRGSTTLFSKYYPPNGPRTASSHYDRMYLPRIHSALGGSPISGTFSTFDLAVDCCHHRTSWRYCLVGFLYRPTRNLKCDGSAARAEHGPTDQRCMASIGAASLEKNFSNIFPQVVAVTTCHVKKQEQELGHFYHGSCNKLFRSNTDGLRAHMARAVHEEPGIRPSCLSCRFESKFHHLRSPKLAAPNSGGVADAGPKPI